MKVVIAIILLFVAGLFLFSTQDDTLPDTLRYQATTFSKFEAEHPQNTLFKIYKFRADNKMIVLYELDSVTTTVLDNYINQSKTNFRNQGFKLTEFELTGDFVGVKDNRALFHTLIEFEGKRYPVLLMQDSAEQVDSATSATTIQAMKEIKLP